MPLTVCAGYSRDGDGVVGSIGEGTAVESVMREDPRARTPEGESEMGVPSKLIAGLPGRMEVPAILKPLGEGVKTTPLTVCAG